MFPSSGFNISDLGTPHIVGSNVSVNAEIWRWTGIVLPVVITVTHTYTLGNLTTGEYFFKLTTWGCTVKSITFTVPIIVPDDYPTIQEAINNANEGDKIYVRNGTYYENGVVNKSVSLFGEDREAAILDGRRLGTVIEVIRDNVMITNLTISNSSGECPCSGIILRGVKDCKISGNNIVDNYGDGVYLLVSSNNNISKNSISGNDVDGIALAASSENNIFENDISTNGWDGVFIGAQSSTNNIYLNDIALNVEGICTVYASDSRIFHNSFIDNGQQASSHDSSTVWDNGYPSGGNYWSDYAGVDSDGDGIGDTPYIIDADNQDRYPLMNPWGTGTPFASFTWSPAIPKVDELVTFDASSSTSIGGTITKYYWDFGDGKNATGQITTHAYANSGTCTVTLNIADSEGLWDIEQKQIQVVQPCGPKAEFTWIPSMPKVGDFAIPIFDASASTSGWNGTHEMPITEYRWDFGDGNKIIRPIPIVQHIFGSSGNYCVTLTVYAPGATPETDSTTHKVTVISAPVGGYSIPIKDYTTTKPLTLYLALIGILTASFTMAKRRKKQQS